jgi:hypothetical protein
MLPLADLGETDEGIVLFKKVGMMDIKKEFLFYGTEIKMKNGKTLGFCLLIVVSFLFKITASAEKAP